jgi:hypothetical protein
MSRYPMDHRVHISAHSAERDGKCSERGWGRAPPPSPAWANISILKLKKRTPESGRCHFVCTVPTLRYEHTVLEF